MLRSLLAVPAVVVETLTAAAAAVAAAPFGGGVQEGLIRLWARTVVASCGIDLTVEGAENLSPEARYVFLSNHQSHLDVPCLVTALPNSIRFVAKRELFKIPIFGQGLRAVGTIDIDRRDSQEAHARIHDQGTQVAREHSLLFFAEGTRSLDGRLQPFKKGGIATALDLQLPMVPVAVSGTIRVLPKGFNLIRPGPVRVVIGSPIAPSAVNTREERDRLRALLELEVGHLYERASAGPS